MKNIRTYFLSILAAGLVLSLSCDEENELTNRRISENPIPGGTTGDSGSLNVGSYVAIGNSLTAGFMDGALYTDGQNNSFPALLARQFQSPGVGGSEFVQPDINSANGFSGNGPNGPLGRFELSLSLLRPVPTAGEVPTAYTGDKTRLKNFGVPGMRLTDIHNPGLAANGLYARFATNPGVSTVLGEAIGAGPTFYTFWLGNNDVLGYAAGGGTDEAQITDAATFQGELAFALSQLAATGAEGMVLNIPPIVLAPYFRAVPYNAVPLDAATATVLNGAFAGYNQILQLLAAQNFISAAEATARQVTYAAGQNAILMDDDALTDIGPILDGLVAAQLIDAATRAALEPFRIARQATPNDLPTLPAATEIGRDLLGNGTALVGISYPISDRFILSGSEVVNVVTARATFNAIIDGVVAQINAGAGATRIRVVDVHPIFADVFGLDAATATALALTPAGIAAADGTLGIEVEGTTLAPDFSPNGVTSTDGIHPNPRGHALIANAIIDAMNAAYGASIPRVSVLPLRGVITTD